MLLFYRQGPTDLSTVVLVQGDAYYTHSTAILRTVALLNPPWSYASALVVLPAAIRDVCYRLVARNRYVRLLPQGLRGAMDRRVPYRGPHRPIAPPR